MLIDEWNNIPMRTVNALVNWLTLFKGELGQQRQQEGGGGGTPDIDFQFDYDLKIWGGGGGGGGVGVATNELQ